MAVENLNQAQSYEWVGSVEIQNSANGNIIKLSGKVTYTPESGIRLKLVYSEQDLALSLNRESLSKKIMHAVLRSDNKTAYFTLIDVFLSPNHTIGNPTATVFEGSASAMIPDELIEIGHDNFKKISIEYDEHFTNVIFFPTLIETDSLKLSKGKKLKLSNTENISFNVESSGTIVRKADDLDTVFFTRDEKKFSELKEAMRPYLDDNPFILIKRNKNSSSIVFEGLNYSLKDYLNLERNWKLFWELIIDNPISIKNFYVHFSRKTHDGKEYSQKRPCLCSYFTPKKSFRSTQRIHELPINFRSFSANGENLSDLIKPIKSWNKICKADEWKPVIDSIHRFLKSEMADTVEFAAVISDIETFLDLQGEKQANIDKLIEIHGYDKWNKELGDIAKNISPNETLGKWLREVRNVIAHPKSCAKKAGGKYKTVVDDKFQLNKIYAYTAALLMKAIMKHVTELDDSILEKYTHRLIEMRVSIFPIEFED